MNIKELWILSAVTIVNFTLIIGVLKWSVKMIVGRQCKKIINDFNKTYAKMGIIEKSQLRPMLMERYNLSNWKATKCIKYLRENGYVVEHPTFLYQEVWVVQ